MIVGSYSYVFVTGFHGTFDRDFRYVGTSRGDWLDPDEGLPRQVVCFGRLEAESDLLLAYLLFVESA